MASPQKQATPLILAPQQHQQAALLLQQQQQQNSLNNYMKQEDLLTALAAASALGINPALFNPAILNQGNANKSNCMVSTASLPIASLSSVACVPTPGPGSLLLSGGAPTSLVSSLQSPLSSSAVNPSSGVPVPSFPPLNNVSAISNINLTMEMQHATAGTVTSGLANNFQDSGASLPQNSLAIIEALYAQTICSELSQRLYGTNSNSSLPSNISNGNISDPLNSLQVAALINNPVAFGSTAGLTSQSLGSGPSCNAVSNVSSLPTAATSSTGYSAPNISGSGNDNYLTSLASQILALSASNTGGSGIQNLYRGIMELDPLSLAYMQQLQNLQTLQTAALMASNSNTVDTLQSLNLTRLTSKINDDINVKAPAATQSAIAQLLASGNDEPKQSFNEVLAKLQQELHTKKQQEAASQQIANAAAAAAAVMYNPLQAAAAVASLLPNMSTIYAAANVNPLSNSNNMAALSELLSSLTGAQTNQQQFMTNSSVSSALALPSSVTNSISQPTHSLDAANVTNATVSSSAFLSNVYSTNISNTSCGTPLISGGHMSSPSAFSSVSSQMQQQQMQQRQSTSTSLNNATVNIASGAPSPATVTSSVSSSTATGKRSKPSNKRKRNQSQLHQHQQTQIGLLQTQNLSQPMEVSVTDPSMANNNMFGNDERGETDSSMVICSDPSSIEQTIDEVLHGLRTEQRTITLPSREQKTSNSSQMVSDLPSISHQSSSAISSQSSDGIFLDGKNPSYISASNQINTSNAMSSSDSTFSNSPFVSLSSQTSNNPIYTTGLSMSLMSAEDHNSQTSSQNTLQNIHKISNSASQLDGIINEVASCVNLLSSTSSYNPTSTISYPSATLSTSTGTTSFIDCNQGTTDFLWSTNNSSVSGVSSTRNNDNEHIVTEGIDLSTTSRDASDSDRALVNETVAMIARNSKKRRKISMDVYELPLTLGWKRETMVTGIGPGGILGDVTYTSSCGMKFSSLEFIRRYFSTSPSTELSVDNFTFKSHIQLGEFYQMTTNADSFKLTQVSLEDLKSAQQHDTSNANWSNYSTLKSKASRKVGKAERLTPSDLSGAEHSSDKSTESKKRGEPIGLMSTLDSINGIDLDNYTKQFEGGVSMPLYHEPCKVELIPAKTFTELMVEKLEKNIKEHNLEAILLETAEESLEDVALYDTKNTLPVPTTVLGKEFSHLPSSVLADCLMVVEFLHSFADILRIDIETIPTVETFMLALDQGKQSCKDAVTTLLLELLKFGVTDPGIVNAKAVSRLIGYKLSDIHLSEENLSTVLRIFIVGRNGFENDLSDSLEHKTFWELTPTQQAESLAFLCDEIMGGRLISCEIDQIFEQVSTIRQEKYKAQKKLRDLSSALNFRRQGSFHESTFQSTVNVPSLKHSMSLDVLDPNSCPTVNLQTDSADTESVCSSSNLSNLFRSPSQVHSSSALYTSNVGEEGLEPSFLSQPSLNATSNAYPLQLLSSTPCSTNNNDPLQPLHQQIYDIEEEERAHLYRIRLNHLGVDRYQRNYFLLPHSLGLCCEGMREHTPIHVDEFEPDEFMNNYLAKRRILNFNTITSKTNSSSNKRSTVTNQSKSTGNPTNVVISTEEEKNSSHPPEENIKEESKDPDPDDNECKTIATFVENEPLDLTFKLIKTDPESSDPDIMQFSTSLIPGNVMKSGANDSCFKANDNTTGLSSMVSCCSIPIKCFESKDINAIQEAFQRFLSTTSIPLPETVVQSLFQCSPVHPVVGDFLLDLANLLCNSSEPHSMETSTVVKSLIRDHITSIRRCALASVAQQLGPCYRQFTSMEQVREFVERVNAGGLVERETHLASNMRIMTEQIAFLMSRDKQGTQPDSSDKEGILPLKIRARSSRCFGGARIESISLLQHCSNSSQALLDPSSSSNALASTSNLISSIPGNSTTCPSIVSIPLQSSTNETQVTTSSASDSSSEASLLKERFLAECALVHEVEALEDRVLANSLQAKQWQAPLKVVDDDAIELKPSWLQKRSRFEQYPLDVTRRRLLELEQHIERRYLLPPLNRKRQIQWQEAPQGSSSSSNGEGSTTTTGVGDFLTVVDGSNQGSVDAEEELPLGLLRWRQSVDSAKDIEHLKECITQIEGAIAWDKSIMKVLCQICSKDSNEAQLLICDGCDSGYHTYCFRPPLDNIPAGDWFCYVCISKASDVSLCYICGGSETAQRRRIGCYNCHRLIHLDCSQPPLQRTVRRWLCNACISAGMTLKMLIEQKKNAFASTNLGTTQISGTSTPGNSESKKVSLSSRSATSLFQSNLHKTTSQENSPVTSNKGTPKSRRRTMLQSKNKVEISNTSTPLSSTHHNTSGTSWEQSTDSDANAPDTNPLKVSIPLVNENDALNNSNGSSSSATKVVEMDSATVDKDMLCDVNCVAPPLTTSVSNTDTTEDHSDILPLEDFNCDSEEEEEEEDVHDRIGEQTHLTEDSEMTERRMEMDVQSGTEESMTKSSMSLRGSGIQSSRPRHEKDEEQMCLEDQHTCEASLKDLSLQHSARFFLRPVNLKKFPSYKKINKHPMDLSTVKSKLDNSKYHHVREFVSDIRLICDNCQRFNIDNSDIGKAGFLFRTYFETHWKDLCDKN